MTLFQKRISFSLSLALAVGVSASISNQIEAKRVRQIQARIESLLEVAEPEKANVEEED